MTEKNLLFLLTFPIRGVTISEVISENEPRTLQEFIMNASRTVYAYTFTYAFYFARG